MSSRHPSPPVIEKYKLPPIHIFRQKLFPKVRKSKVFQQIGTFLVISAKKYMLIDALKLQRGLSFSKSCPLKLKRGSI